MTGVLIIVGIVLLAVATVVAVGAVLRKRRGRPREEMFRDRPHGRGRVGRIR